MHSHLKHRKKPIFRLWWLLCCAMKCSAIWWGCVAVVTAVGFRSIPVAPAAHQQILLSSRNVLILPCDLALQKVNHFIIHLVGCAVKPTPHFYFNDCSSQILRETFLLVAYRLGLPCQQNSRCLWFPTHLRWTRSLNRQCRKFYLPRH